MKFNTIFSIFTPKDARFVQMLQQTSNYLVEAATLLERLFVAPESERKEICSLIKVEEIKGDKTTKHIFKALNETFITPFDREDIHALADALDDVIDAINRSAHKVFLYHPTQLPKYNQQMAQLIYQGALVLQNSTQALSSVSKNSQAIRQQCREIKRLEELADAVYEEGIMNLFSSELNAIELIKLKEIIQELEKSANKIHNVSKILRTIIVKYA